MVERRKGPKCCLCTQGPPLSLNVLSANVSQVVVAELCCVAEVAVADLEEDW